MPSDRVSILRHAAAHPLPGVIDQDFAHFWHRRKIALVDAAPDPDPFALFRGRDAQFKHQDPVGGQSLHQPMHERGLVIGIVKRRRQQDHIEQAVGQLFPALLVELARGEAGPGALDERPRLVDADSARCALELCKAAEKALRSEEHTSELQSLMRLSYAVFCLQKKKQYAKIRMPTFVNQYNT